MRSENKIAESRPIMISCSGSGRISQGRKAPRNFSKISMKISITNLKNLKKDTFKSVNKP
jgi:hypothetical protein